MSRIPPPVRAEYPRIVFTVLMLALAGVHGHFGFDHFSVLIGVGAALPWVLPEVRQLFSSIKIQGVGEFNFRELSQKVEALQQVAKEGAGGKPPARTEGESPKGNQGAALSPGESQDEEGEAPTVGLTPAGLTPAGPAPKYPDDPNKGMFGYEPDRDGYRLSATVTAMPGSNDWYEVLAWVDKLTPGDAVEFHLHPSFGEGRTVVPVKDITGGRAELKRIAFGAFTMGAKVKTGGRIIPLELDLADLKSAPAAFRGR